MDFLQLLQTHWPHVLAVTGPIAAIVVFLSQVLQVRKLRYEVIKLQNEASERGRAIKLATTNEMEKYGNPGSYRFQVSSRVITLCLALAFSGPILLVMRSVLQDINLNAPSRPQEAPPRLSPPMLSPPPEPIPIPTAAFVIEDGRIYEHPEGRIRIARDGDWLEVLLPKQPGLVSPNDPLTVKFRLVDIPQGQWVQLRSDRGYSSVALPPGMNLALPVGINQSNNRLLGQWIR